jgi:predicted metal-dependent HD superfamily phosphohydrolase
MAVETENVISLERWSAMCGRLRATSDTSATYQALIRAYGEPHRAYHTLTHLRDCLREFDAAAHLAEHPEEVEAGLWFHDAVYDTRRTDNEERAADWSRRALSDAGVPTEAASRVAALVLATRHEAPATGPDAALLVDIDLSILGHPFEEFDIYERQIRLEYSWVSENEFRQGRSRILESLLARPAIYQTSVFKERYEAQARSNLARSLELLRA